MDWWRNSPRSTHCWRGWRGEERWICIQSRFLGYAIVANYNCTKSFRFDLKCTKIASGWGSAPDPAGGAYSAPPDPLAVNKGRGREGRGGGGEGRGEGGEGEGGGGEGRGGGRGEGRGGDGMGLRDFAPPTSTSWLRHWLHRMTYTY